MLLTVYGTEWPIMCSCAVKKLLTHPLRCLCLYGVREYRQWQLQRVDYNCQVLLMDEICWWSLSFVKVGVCWCILSHRASCWAGRANSLICYYLEPQDHSQLINSIKSIAFCSIPSHVGIRGNENADTAAKAGLDVAISNMTNMRFPASDLLTCVNQLCVKEWQQLWNQRTSNKLYSVQLVIVVQRIS